MLDPEQERKLAASLFNRVWELLDKPDRTAAEVDEMIHAAHASRHHWGPIGQPVNWARGEWQVSRVYAVLGRAEPALFHARRCLELCTAHGIGDFDRAYAYEALARASAVAGAAEDRDRYLALARTAAADIRDPDDRAPVDADLATIPMTRD